jgi:hypothetical protein
VTYIPSDVPNQFPICRNIVRAADVASHTVTNIHLLLCSVKYLVVAVNVTILLTLIVVLVCSDTAFGSWICVHLDHQSVNELPRSVHRVHEKSDKIQAVIRSLI